MSVKELEKHNEIDRKIVQKMNNSKKSFVHNVYTVLLYLLSALFFVLTLELVFAALHIGEDEFIQLQPYTGFGHIANKQITWRKEGFSTTEFSQLGYRGKEISLSELSDIKNRIAFTGDSVVESLQVPENKSFPKLIESKLNKDGSSCHIFNFGVSAYGNLQEYYQYIRYIKQVKPKLLVLFYHYGDSDKNICFNEIEKFLPRPYAQFDSNMNLQTNWKPYFGYINSESFQNYQKLDFLRKHSRIYAVWSRIALQLNSSEEMKPIITCFDKIQNIFSANLQTKFRLKSKFERLSQGNRNKFLDSIKDSVILSSADMQIIQKTISNLDNVPKEKLNSVGKLLVAHENRFLVTAGIIAALAKECQKNDCKLLVVGLPAPDNSMFYFRELKALAHLTNKFEFKFLDLNNYFPRLNCNADKTGLYYHVGNHLTAKGHQYLADILQLEIAKHL